MDGYETISVNQRFPVPWYEIPPIDFVSENLVATEIRDERVVDFELVPKASVSMSDVLIHADQLRGEVQPLPGAAASSPVILQGSPNGEIQTLPIPENQPTY